MNDNAETICAENIDNCGACPITVECNWDKPENEGWYYLRLNNAADKVVGA